MENIQPNQQRAKHITLAFYLGIAVTILAVYSGILEHDLLLQIQSGSYVTIEEAEANDLRQSIMGIVQLIVSITIIVLFLKWFRRAYSNLERSHIHIEHNENQAIWGFAIPFINLVRPYQIMVEIWEKMQRRIAEINQSFQVNDNKALIISWWAFFIISGIIGQLVFRLAFKDESLQGLITSNEIMIASDTFDILAMLATVIMIKKVSKVEDEFYYAAHQTTTDQPNNLYFSNMVSEQKKDIFL